MMGRVGAAQLPALGSQGSSYANNKGVNKSGMRFDYKSKGNAS